MNMKIEISPEAKEQLDLIPQPIRAQLMRDFITAVQRHDTAKAKPVDLAKLRREEPIFYKRLMASLRNLKKRL